VVVILEVSPLRGEKVVVIGVVIIWRGLPVFPGGLGKRQPLAVHDKPQGIIEVRGISRSPEVAACDWAGECPMMRAQALRPIVSASYREVTEIQNLSKKCEALRIAAEAKLHACEELQIALNTKIQAFEEKKVGFRSNDLKDTFSFLTTDSSI
jgi:hypothetical protein